MGSKRYSGLQSLLDPQFLEAKGVVNRTAEALTGADEKLWSVSHKSNLPATLPKGALHTNVDKIRQARKDERKKQADDTERPLLSARQGSPATISSRRVQVDNNASLAGIMRMLKKTKPPRQQELLLELGLKSPGKTINNESVVKHLVMQNLSTDIVAELEKAWKEPVKPEEYQAAVEACVVTSFQATGYSSKYAPVLAGLVVSKPASGLGTFTQALTVFPAYSRRADTIPSMAMLLRQSALCILPRAEYTHMVTYGAKRTVVSLPDQSLNVIVKNPAATSFYSYGKAELLRVLGLLHFLTSQWLAAYQQHVESAKQSGTPVQTPFEHMKVWAAAKQLALISVYKALADMAKTFHKDKMRAVSTIDNISSLPSPLPTDAKDSEFKDEKGNFSAEAGWAATKRYLQKPERFPELIDRIGAIRKAFPKSTLPDRYYDAAAKRSTATTAQRTAKGRRPASMVPASRSGLGTAAKLDLLVPQKKAAGGGGGGGGAPGAGGGEDLGEDLGEEQGDEEFGG